MRGVEGKLARTLPRLSRAKVRARTNGSCRFQVLEPARIERKLALQRTVKIQTKRYAALRDIAISRHMGYMVRHDKVEDREGSCERNQNTHIAIIARVPQEQSVHRLDLATRSSSSFFYSIGSRDEYGSGA